jgi:hypothetical protein
VNLDNILDKITSYSDVTKNHNYKWVEGGGIKPWSHKYVGEGGKQLDIRSSEWTAYDEEGKECAVGPDPLSLDNYLRGELNEQD